MDNQTPQFVFLRKHIVINKIGLVIFGNKENIKNQFHQFTQYSFNNFFITSISQPTHLFANIPPQLISRLIYFTTNKLSHYDQYYIVFMVFFWIPNLIGYARVILLIVAAVTAFTNPIATVLCYGISQALDAFDGMAARAFNQSSDFGAVLDMVTDRVSDAIILAILGSLYPKICWLFFTGIALDIGSHWYQMYSTLAGGQKHHKTATTNWKLLHIYYHNKAVLFWLVAGNEIFFLTAYLNAFKDQLWSSALITTLNTGALAISFVLFLIKQLMSVIQLISASQKIVEIDMKKRKDLETKAQ